MNGGSIETVGDNKEFTVDTVSDVTIYFTDNSKTSDDDTTTEKYFNNTGAVKAWALIADKTVQVVSLNGIEFTDPKTVVLNTVWAERLDTPVIFKMVVRTTTTATNIKLRVRGR